MKKNFYLLQRSLLWEFCQRTGISIWSKSRFQMSTIKLDDKQDDLDGKKCLLNIPSISVEWLSTNSMITLLFRERFCIHRLELKEKIDGVNAGGMYFGESTKVTFGTLLVPVSAKYFITEGFSVAAGVNVGIILTAKQKTVIGSDFLDVENGR